MSASFRSFLFACVSASSVRTGEVARRRFALDPVRIASSMFCRFCDNVFRFSACAAFVARMLSNSSMVGDLAALRERDLLRERERVWCLRLLRPLVRLCEWLLSLSELSLSSELSFSLWLCAFFDLRALLLRFCFFLLLALLFFLLRALGLRSLRESGTVASPAWVEFVSVSATAADVTMLCV